MNYLYIAVKLIRKQIYVYIIFGVMVLISLLYVVPLSTQIKYQKDVLNELERLDIENGIYLYCNFIYSRVDRDFQNVVDNAMKECDGIISRGTVYNITDENIDYNVIMYNQTIIEKYSPILKNGEWLDTVNLEKTSNIPVVITSDLDYRTGDTIELNVAGNILECIVSGVFEKGKLIPTFYGAADDENFTADFMFSNAENTIIIPGTKKINQILEDERGNLIASGSIVYTDGTLEIDDAREKLGFAGVITDIDKGEQRFKKESVKTIKAQSIHFFLCLFVSVLCCWINSIIGEYKIIRNYQIYYLVGMSKSAQVCIEFIKGIIIVIVLSVFSYMILLNTGYFEFFYENRNRIIYFMGTIVYMALMYCPSFAFNLYQAKKHKSPIIRE